MGEQAEYELERELNDFNYMFQDFYRKKTIPCWMTREGEVIPISSMETSHIKNCISLLERQNRTTSRAYPILLAELKIRE